MQKGRAPFNRLGQRLSEIRRKLQETITEVSGAIEVDNEELLRFERGELRPSEDILALLINHFDVRDDEADELWDLAGYNSKEETSQPPTLLVVPMDNRIIYSDTAHVSINNFGVVMNFMQNGLNNQPASIARIGMSLDHAKSVLKVLNDTIKQAEAAKTPKNLPSTVKSSSKKKTN